MTSQFRRAAETGDLSLAMEAVEESTAIDRTAINVAIQSKHTNVALFLIKSWPVGAYYPVSEEVATEGITTPLHLSAKGGYEDVVRALLDKGVPLDDVDRNGETALHMAVQNPRKGGSIQIVNLLLDRGANVEVRNMMGTTPLILAFTQPSNWSIANTTRKYENPFRVSMFTKLVTKVTLDAVDRHQVTPLYTAIRNGRDEFAQLLIEEGCDVDVSCTLHGHSPLHIASGRGQLHLVRSLMACGALLDGIDLLGETPLHAAIRNGFPETALELLAGGCEAHLPAHGRLNRTPLHIACNSRMTAVAKAILAKRAPVNDVDSFGNTALFFAKSTQNAELVKLLTALGGRHEVWHMEI